MLDMFVATTKILVVEAGPVCQPDLACVPLLFHLPGNTKGGSITVPLTYRLTGLD